MLDFPWQLAHPYTRARACLGLRLCDFETVVPSPECPFEMPHLPLNPDVVSIFDDQAPFILNPWQVLLPWEHSWDPSDPSRTHPTSNSLRTGTTVPIIAHQLFIAQVLVSWFCFQVFGPPHMQAIIIWNAHLRNEVIGNLDLSLEIVSQFDDVLSTILDFEQCLLWLSQVRASVAYSFHFADLLDQIVQICGAGFYPIWSNYSHPLAAIQVLPANWFDPQEPLAPNQPNEQSTWFQFPRMVEFYDHLAEAATMLPPDFDDPDPVYTARVLEGYKLDKFVREVDLNWWDFTGTALVVTADVETEGSIELHLACDLPLVALPHHPLVTCSPPHLVVALPRLIPDTRAVATTFTHEAHHPIGAVVLQLLLRCPHCDLGRFCSDDTDPNAKRPNKLHRTCYHCNKQHKKCQTWTDFQEVFNERIEGALWEFRFEFWEHLGKGRYQLLLPDPRLVDLIHLVGMVDS
ncbi:hypothetical protein B0H13DRAFT_2373847 [Mycena leptocephala]|nr:hypothetical protein B0H13DRAFT_2373847 [Mycena leptocephala]